MPRDARAAAAALLQDSDNTDAALSAKQAADQYGLIVLQENILSGADVPVMHFLAISRQPNAAQEQHLSSSEETVSVYALQCANIQEALTLLQQKGAHLSNVYPIDKDVFYLEIEGTFNPTQMSGCIPLGTYAACQNRKFFQPLMKTELFSTISLIR